MWRRPGKPIFKGPNISGHPKMPDTDREDYTRHTALTLLNHFVFCHI